MNPEPGFDYLSIATNSIRDAIDLAEAADLRLDELPESTPLAERISLETQVSLAKSAAAASGLALHEAIWQHGKRVVEDAERYGI